MSRSITVTCPHCGTTLEIDVEAGVILGHTPPKVEKKAMDFDERLRLVEAEKKRAADRMAEAMRAEKAKGRILEDRFQKLLDEAKDAPDEPPPIKDIDL
ncbi:MAG: hypothetical protein GXP48_04500 [Acidobacteria bacterium]|nr:hypothetical protein [Acidobacteriota bacterium]